MVVSTLVSAIRRRRPDAEIFGISMTPGDTESRHGIRAYPINPGMPMSRQRGEAARDEPAPSGRRRALARIPGARRLYHAATATRVAAREVPFALRSYRFLRTLDAVVVAGSGQLLDEWDPWLHPYTTFRWALLSRLARARFVYASVGTGPIRSPLSAFFFRHAVRWGSYVSIRDDYSVGILESIGLRGPFVRYPDMAYAYPGLVETSRAARRTTGEERPVVGLQVIAYKHPTLWPRGDVRLYEPYFRKMVGFARRLLEAGCTVRVFSSQVASDNVVAQELLEALGEPLAPGRLEFIGPELNDVDDLVSAIARCDVVVAARFHAALVPLALGVPVLGLAYNPKTTELFADYGLGERCLDIDEFAPEELEAAFEAVRADGVPAGVEDRVAANRAAVEAQFDELFGRPVV